MEYGKYRSLWSAHISLLVVCMLPEYSVVEQSHQACSLRKAGRREAHCRSIVDGESVDFLFDEQVHEVRVKLTAAEQADFLESDLG